ncbi:DUF6233 domain-containing protein [Streptomyces noursei]|uniref:DUF6233 domain-containing protein n=1 Tax=Streptomyces noursei TaxID=1971 RepID=UPI0003A9AC3D
MVANRWAFAANTAVARRSGVAPPSPDQAETAERLLTDAEALQMLADPSVSVPCPVCRPDTVLRHP